MRNIVFIHLFNDRSGSPRVLSQVINAIFNAGYNVETLTSCHSYGFLDGVPGTKRTIFYKRSENKFVTLFFYMISQVHLFFYCFRYLKVDAIFYVNTMMPFGAALAAKIMGKTVVYHVHETSIRPLLLKRFLRLIIKITAGKILFVSNYLKNAEAFENIPQYVVHNALSTTVAPCRRKNNEIFNILMVCSLKKYKGVLEFFSVAEKLLGNPILTFTLVLNATAEEIENFCLTVPPPENMRLISRQSNMEPFYNSASLLLNLSRPDEWIETFGLTIIEAMAKGLPVIVPPVGGPAELISDGQEGYLISCYEVEEICSAISRLAEDSNLYENMSRHAVRRAQDFELAEFNKRMIDVIDQ
ncbi:glycosyltransferase family 4 protein [Pseudomonas sp. p1(2021b)]|uniref:glycosyltransferase family 4 protein n=1 Tax=Pseudomonas sp. p1(2021b) TaxID=2874628 RepID=UPI001CCFDD5F|nr:glycosyltransferase family 4 protein [Pseudomonas sp. p1(2021b)]UBM26568.1 glycosyltransferase family 4 protein [Pseudomonas sp. p1(2021b)]